jgi:hypothetical protein
VIARLESKTVSDRDHRNGITIDSVIVPRRTIAMNFEQANLHFEDQPLHIFKKKKEKKKEKE